MCPVMLGTKDTQEGHGICLLRGKQVAERDNDGVRI